MLARGETEGTFQLNGSGMTRYLKELQPRPSTTSTPWWRSIARARWKRFRNTSNASKNPKLVATSTRA
jgi:hypothetical protein